MINNYLTEELLGKFLIERFINEKIYKQYKIDKFKVDYFLESTNLVVEFNGYRHYSETKNIERDNKVLNSCKLKNINIIFIPYFVQLDSTIIKYYFEQYGILNFDNFNSYPHGFIDNKAMRPIDYCFKGLVRYFSELQKLPLVVSNQIKNTDELKDKKLEHFLQDYIKEIL